ncbi:MAG: amidohydrolase [Actinobacteria bacterium]|nr:amidohydrolase [Actinomycetota bacterium]
MSSPVRVLRCDALITCVDDTVAVRRNAEVGISNSGRITHVSDHRPANDTVAADVGGLLMPGLVNTHSHGPMTLLRGVGDGLALDRWLGEAIWPREAKLQPGDVEWGMRMASIEMLEAGVTTSCEMYFADDEIIEAVRSTGGRIVCTPGVVGAVHLSSLHEPGGRIADIKRLHTEHHDIESLVTVGVAPHSPYDVPIEAVAALAALARDLDTLLHIHIAETETEGAALEASYGSSTVSILDDHGVLDGNVLAAHSVWLSPSDIAVFATRNVSVAHCPKSNMKLGSGIAPIVAMHAAGVNVGLGTDGVASNDDLELWDELQLTPLLARVSSEDPSVLDAPTSLLMATSRGATALGLNTGTLAPGSWADIIRIDLDHRSFQPIVTDADVVQRVVWNAKRQHVTDVWVGGSPVVTASEVTTVDAIETTEEVKRRGTRLSA